MTKIVSIIKSNCGNVFNVVKAFEYIGARVNLVSTGKELKKSDYLVFPGVGTYFQGMEALERYDLSCSIKEWVTKEKPFLGICLGMQLLFESSEEFGFNKGLGIIKGKVKRLPKSLDLKVPNISWQPLYYNSQSLQSDTLKKTILKNYDFNKDLYFVHSYACYPESKSSWLAVTRYGNHEFCSVVKEKNLFGFQFHPEKSGDTGLKLLEEFLKE